MIGKVSEGLGVSARKLNEIIDAVNRILGLSVQPPLQLATANGSFQLRVSAELGGAAGVWVRVTGAVSGGYYPGVIRTFTNSGFTDGTVTVQARGANAETLVVGRVYLAVEQEPSTTGVARYVVTRGSGGSVATCTANADNAGTAWTAGTLQETGELVELQPRYGTGITLGAVTFPPHKLFNSLEYVCRDTGTVNGSNGRRRFLAWPIGLITCDTSDPNTPTLVVL